MLETQQKTVSDGNADVFNDLTQSLNVNTGRTGWRKAAGQARGGRRNSSDWTKWPTKVTRSPKPSCSRRAEQRSPKAQMYLHLPCICVTVVADHSWS